MNITKKEFNRNKRSVAAKIRYYIKVVKECKTIEQIENCHHDMLLYWMGISARNDAGKVTTTASFEYLLKTFMESYRVEIITSRFLLLMHTSPLLRNDAKYKVMKEQVQHLIK